ncbi:MAG: hypothetical protein IPH35_17335 [Rhodoferax sp.]|nr:hypothetical protein [Rhodoferax sp.]
MNKMSMRQDWRMFSVATAVEESWNGETIAEFLRKVFAKWDFFPLLSSKTAEPDLGKGHPLVE